MALRSIGVKLMADVSNFTSGMTRAGMSAKDFGQKLDKSASANKLDKVGDAAGAMGLALGGAFTFAVKSAADFDKAMSSVSAATHAGNVEMNQLRQAALQAGKDTMYSATQAADGITELSKAGVSTADILGGGLKGALSLAAAGQMDVGDAAETAASAMTQFKLSGSQLPHVADLLAAGAGKAQGSVKDMGMALNQSGLVAAQFGLSIEDTTGVLGEFASAGLTGSDAGTSLKTMLLALANPSKQTKDEMDALGISFYDASGKFIGFNGVAQVLQTRLKGLTDAQRQQALGQIFGNDAIRSASILYTDGAAGVNKWKNAVNDSGYAAETAQKQTDNLAGDIERLKGSLETMAIEGGSGANKGLRVLVQNVNNLVNAFANLPSGISATLTIMAGIGGALLLGGAAWVKYRKAIAEVKEQLEAVGPAGEKASAGLSKVTGVAGRATAVMAGLQIAGMAINAAFGSEVTANTDAFAQSLSDWASNGTEAGEAARIFGKDFDHLSYDLGTLGSGGMAKFGNGVASVAESISGLGNTMDESLTHAQQRLGQVDAALTAMVSNGQSQQAAEIFSKLAEEGKKAGISVSDLKNGLPNYSAAVANAAVQSKNTANKVGDLNSALDTGAAAQDKYATYADQAAGAARGELEAMSQLSKQIKAQTDPVFGLITAEDDLKKAQKEAAAATKQHGKNSDEARTATQKLALAAIALQGAAGAAAGTLKGKMTPELMATLKAAHLTDGQIADVAKQFRTAKSDAEKYSGDYAANVSAPGAKQAKTDIDKAYTSANHFAGPYVAKLTVSGDKAVDAKLAQLLIKQRQLASGLSYSSAAAAVQKDLDRNRQGAYATGGWTGPGSTHEPAGIVHADEFVIKKSSRQKIENSAPGLLDFMNQHGGVPEDVVDATPGYAGGGRVWPFPADVSKAKIPELTLAGPTGGGMTWPWIVAAVRAALPGLHAISTFRPGATTLTGNRSYHAVGRAVDFPASKPLAEWVNLHYMARTKELITPWNSLNVHNGKRHTYTGAVWNQHNFAGGNAHDHWAMANGGVIPEPVVGIGTSGRTYSFGERGPETVVPNGGTWQTAGGSGAGATQITYEINVAVSPTANKAEIGREVVGVIQAYERGSGKSWRS